MSHKSDAEELMANYWSRDALTDQYGDVDYQADSLARVAEQLAITNYLLMALVEK